MTDAEIYRIAVEAYGMAIKADCHSDDDLRLLAHMLSLTPLRGAELEPLVDRALDEHPKELAQYRAGKLAARNFFVGCVMKATNGRADSSALNAFLDRKLAA